ncbi:Uridylate kinase [Candidatus Clavichlamydia salmonicola]|uniref:UMP kinase n=1 Tax=Candidatus Clavichlamydia salmonicola TaxID=469812 RepID=UPI0018919D8D|nr:UMP kinase [Candidatus Clavichlamydia salmonicola]MBF5050712.1 Uridylate kinase [Candidatus Clavichlamydia salmonicola]
MIKRVLLKLSGAAFCSKGNFGFDSHQIKNLAFSLKTIQDKNIGLSIVLGGGNIFRGVQGSSLSLSRLASDQMGMLSTVLNGIALHDALSQEGASASLFSSFVCPQIANVYKPQEALRRLNDGQIIICTGGAGNPYLTTDTAAALRACEIKADLLLKATTCVDGVYDKDPLIFDDAIHMPKISYEKFLEMKLKVMDLSAITLCMINAIPIRLFKLSTMDLENAIFQSNIGTEIK